MKLLHKTILYYLLISLPLLCIAGVCSYLVINSELEEGLDESLVRDRANAVIIINSFTSSRSLKFGVDSLSSIEIITNGKNGDVYADTSIYDKREKKFITYRVFTSHYDRDHTHYRIRILKPTLEKDELMEGLFSSFALIIGFLIIAFFIVNWLLAKTLWKPFYKTLSELDEYDIKKNRLDLDVAGTKEFNMLNTALNAMSRKIYSDFTQQKEFTENASHEMQTPLAVIKANISLLMQSANMKEEEMNQLQSIENTIKKLSALNKALILLTKIENKQFPENLALDLKDVLNKALNNYSDLFQAKNINPEINLEQNLPININPVLAEILVSNLIQNAIRHNKQNGKIIISISEKTFSIANSGEELMIAKEDLFKRFKKNNASGDSLGLGLSIVKSITDLYGFKISYNYYETLHIFTLKTG